MKKCLFLLAALPLLGLASCLGLREADTHFSPGATEFNQRVAEDIRSADDSLARAARRQRVVGLKQRLRFGGRPAEGRRGRWPFKRPKAPAPPTS